MAKDTNMQLRNQMIYSIYVRNHTKEGTFQSIESDLDRIQKLGTDIIWFLPIHPIGVEGKKGSLGCPYSISDYRKVNPAYGTKEDFVHLVDEIHKRGMKCIIDVVYNHTSHDSLLCREHPEYFYRRKDGRFGNRMGEWEDVYDLDYQAKELWDYQIETLKMWAEIVDGFRCDVASCVPAAFWERAREEVSKVRKDCIWLAESIHSAAVYYCRQKGIPVAADYELYNAFDIEYQYDIIDFFIQYLEGKSTLVQYLDALNMQESIYPENYIKLRYLENHDTPRICQRVQQEERRRNWLAFMYFQKGTMLVYGGQEFSDANTPSLFEIDPVHFDGKDISEEMTRLGEIKKQLPVDAMFEVKQGEGVADVAVAAYVKNDQKLAMGIFSLKGDTGYVSVDLEDGEYQNLVDHTKVMVKDGKIPVTQVPSIFVFH